MTARQGQVATDAFNEKLPKIFPIIDSDCSDSGSFTRYFNFIIIWSISSRSNNDDDTRGLQSDKNMSQTKKISTSSILH